VSDSNGPVERPLKRSEYRIVFGTSEARKGWTDLRATKLNALADAWDLLTRAPLDRTATCHQLRGDLATVTRDGDAHEQWQLELPGGARVWYYVVAGGGKSAGTVVLVRVATAHPKETLRK